MRLEFIDRIKENDILARNILTEDGRILLKSGIKLTESYIYQLKKIGVYYLYIEDERLSDIVDEDESVTELKRIAMHSMASITKNVNITKKDVRQCVDVVEELVENILEIGNVNASLYDIRTYDNYTYVHSVDTGIMSSFLGIYANLDEYHLKQLGIGAMLHDIGKMKIPNKIINKKGSLTKEEFDEIKKHPLYGEKILEKYMSISDIVLRAVVEHHEKINGTGYPFGLKGNEISKFGKIVCVCDVYDAVSNNRSYRNKFAPNEAYELILGGSGTLFDENIVKGFKNTFAVYPLGTCVRLSNNVEGYVIRQNKGFPDRPVIRVLYDSSTKDAIPAYEIDLLDNCNLVIKSIV